MTHFLLRRLLIIPLGLALVNFLGFAYAHYAAPLRVSQTLYGRGETEAAPLWPAYRNFLQSSIQGDFDAQLALPGASRSGPSALGETVRQATSASLGLIAVASTASVLAGLGLGLAAVRTDPPRTARWLTLVSTVGMAMPSFYIGSLFILAAVFYVLWRGPGTSMPVPIGGFGWDAHLILPVLALMARPTVQVAQVTANLLTGELGEQYVVAARSLGHTWRAIRNRYAFRPVVAPVVLTIAGMLRLLVGEMVLVEWLFRWPGLGRLLGWTLVPAQLSSATGSPLFLNPPLMAIVLTLVAAFFLSSDLIAALLVRLFDPRLRSAESAIAKSN